MFSEISKSKYSCSVCKKQYTRKLSLERHTILCDLKTKSKVDLQVEEEEIKLVTIDTHDQVADLQTKYLDKTTTIKHRDAILGKQKGLR